MRLARAAFVLLAIAGISGAASFGCSSSGKVPPFAAGPLPLSNPSTTCPFGIRGARIRMSDVEGGVAIAIVAYGGNVNDVRRRARDAAAMYGPGAHLGEGHDGKHGGGEHHGLGLAQLGVPVEATAEDTAEGARITVRPKAAADLERMRAALNDRERRVRTGECPRDGS